MSKENDDERHSEAGEPDLITDPAQLALAESRNALRQFDLGMDILDEWLSFGKNYRIRISHLLILNRVILEGINRFAGTFRSTPVKIGGSKHLPPDPTQVPIFIEDFCEYINENRDKSAIHLAAFALWRLNWIHPFADGNGRTARIVSYMLLSAGLGYRIPGARTIPEQIAENKTPYYRALENADAAFERGLIDVSEVEALLEEKLATQLLQVHDAAKASQISKSPVNRTGTTVSKRVSKVRHEPDNRQQIRANVEYLRTDEPPYTPVYVINLPPSALTAQQNPAPQKGWVERNSALITAIATIISALIAAAITWLVTKK